MSRSLVPALAFAVLGLTVAVPQNVAQKRALTTADYDRAVKMLAQNLNGLVVGGDVNPNWMPDGRFWYVRTTLTGSENVVIDPAKKTREVVATPPEGGTGGR